jgi:hypothetical protein
VQKYDGIAAASFYPGHFPTEHLRMLFSVRSKFSHRTAR